MTLAAATTTDPPPPRRARRWAIRIVGVLVIVATLAIDRSPLVVVPLVFVLVVPFERWFPRHPEQRLRRPLLSLDVRYALVNPLVNAVGLIAAIAVGLVSLAWLPGLILRPIVALLPAWLVVLMAVVAFDMLGYWGHRWMHEVPQLWRFHAIHHSTEHLDWVSGFRLHPLDGIAIAPPAVFLLAAGVAPTVIGALVAVQIVVGLFLHANVRWRLRPFHRVIATPEFHHWHHANETDARLTNYSGVFPIWDQVFGTYRMPRTIRPLRYGVDEEVPTTMRGQLAYPFRGIPSPRFVGRHPVRSLRAGWRATRRLGGAVVRSTVRPRRRQPAPGEPFRWAATPPVTREPGDVVAGDVHAPGTTV